MGHLLVLPVCARGDEIKASNPNCTSLERFTSPPRTGEMKQVNLVG